MPIPVPIDAQLIDGSHPLLTGRLDSGDRFARAHIAVGDVDGDGVGDLVVGGRSDDDGATDAGAFYVLFLTSDNDIRDVQKVSAVEGGLSAHLEQPLPEGGFFGYAFAAPGDLDSDGVPDLITSSPTTGTLFVLFLNADGTVRDAVQHDGLVDAWALSSTYDFDGDGIAEIAAGNPNAGRGAGELTWLSTSPTGELTTVGSIGVDELSLTTDDGFGGRSIAPVGDVNGDGWPDIVVGAFAADDGRGRTWVVLLDDTGSALSGTSIGNGLGGFTSVLDANDNFGHAVIVLPFSDVPVVVSGANRDDDTFEDAGALYALTLTSTGQVDSQVKWGEQQIPGVSTPMLGRWGRSLSLLGVDGNQATIAVGGGARTTGNIWIVTLERQP